MNFPIGKEDFEKFNKNNPKLMLKAYACYGVTKHWTKQKIFENLDSFYFPTLTPDEMKGRKSIYVLLLFPSEEVVNDRLNKSNYDIGHVVAIHDIKKFLRGYRSDSEENICDCCGKTFQTEDSLNNHLEKGCYARETNQFKLSKDSVFFNSHQTLARNGFAQYVDIESEMVKDMKPDDDWDEEHIPQKIGLHNITEYPEIFKMFDIELHAQFRSKDFMECMEQYANYLLKFDERKEIEHPEHGNDDCKLCKKICKDKLVSFNEYIKNVNYGMKSTQKQVDNYNTTKCCYLCSKSFKDNGDTEDEKEDEEDSEAEDEEQELEIALEIAGKRIARFDEKHWGQTFEYIKKHDVEFCESIEICKTKDKKLKSFQNYLLEKVKLPKHPPLNKGKNREKVPDHDHLKPRENLLGASHSYCNLARQNRRFFIPIIIHNGANYDWHFLIREFLKHKKYQIKPIAKTASKFISFTWGVFHFIDSRRFLNASEEKLANQLANRNEDGTEKKDKNGNVLTDYDKFIQLRLFFESHLNERYRNGDWKLLTKKGALPYEYISPFHYAEKCLPPREKFISKLTGKSITIERYKELQKIWDSFGCQNLGEFLEIYLESDILMLADIFENFRNNSLKYYHLDPANFVSSPSLSYHAMLLLSDVEIQPYPSIEVYRMLFKTKHGGFSQVTTRYVRAINSKSSIIRAYFNDPDFNEKYRTVMPYYLDCNQLYPSAMLYALPIGDWNFIYKEDKELTPEKASKWILNIDKKENENYIPEDNMPLRAQGSKGYIIEFSWYFPEKGNYWNSKTNKWMFCEDLHNRNNDYPLGAETMNPTKVSPFYAKHYNGEVSSDKLIAHLGLHEHDTRHYLEAQEILRQGAVITKIHKILEFTQIPFARDYVIMNNNLRKEATNNDDEFGKDFFKLMNNSCFGQLMMNEMRFKEGKFISGYKKFDNGVKVQKRKLALSNPNCYDWCDIDEDNTFVLFNKMKTLSHPIADGVAILGISKSIMGSFWYRLIDKFGEDRVKLVYTDTDSLVFILIGNTYKEADILSYIREEPDFACSFDLDKVPDVHEVAPEDNTYWSSKKNKKVMMKFKFEKPPHNIAEIGASQSKTNSILYLDDKNKLLSNITSKGISGCCIDDDNPKRDKKQELKEGGVFYMKLDDEGKIIYDKNGEMEFTTEDKKAVVRHIDMIKCVKEGKEAPKVSAYRIEVLTGENAHRIVTKHYTKKTFSVADNKRYQTEDFHSLAYGHKDAKEFILMKDIKGNGKRRNT